MSRTATGEPGVDVPVGTLRVLAATDLFEPAVGGLERAVATLGEALSDRGHVVRVATLSIPGLPGRDRSGALDVIRLAGWHETFGPLYQDRHRPFHPTIPDPTVVKGLVAQIDEFRPDVLHAHGWILHSAIAARRLRPDVRLVVTLHDYSLTCPKKNNTRAGASCGVGGPVRCVTCATGQYGLPRAAALTAGLRTGGRRPGDVDAFVPISRAVLEVSRAAIPAGAVVELIPSPVSDHALAPATGPRPAFVPDGPYLMFAGEASTHKGIDVLAEAHALLGHEPPLLICATRPSAAAPWNALNTTVVVQRDHPEIVAAWRSCAVAVVPSVWQEPLGLSALEAMACGAPTVGTLTGGLRTSIRDEVDGLLVPPADPRALARAIRRLLDDEPLARRLGESARQRARGYAAADVARAHEALYRRLLADG
ncbi:glycosyltransferase family 1 protein [Paraconexibacter algicola]|uniref:Glycosyltransferase family 1 protein n=1 Tax=Paraconexibacter algicola TaxID=2133960 RepID=A0A2T4UC72_9ACTN|nr:glycosyltransferase family 1 protein [Paraconexibacter algicola]